MQSLSSPVPYILGLRMLGLFLESFGMSLDKRQRQNLRFLYSVLISQLSTGREYATSVMAVSHFV
jgi:hypothetical protein